MNKEKMDRRVRTTKRMLRGTLINLMTTRKLNDISVKELCELADVNRSTFYLHYHDVYDLYEQIEEEIFREITDSIKRYAPGEKMGIPENCYPVVLDILKYVAENADACTMLLGQSRDQAFLQRLTNIGRQECVANWRRVYRLKEEETAEFFYSFIVAGCIGLLERWLKSECGTSVMDLAHLAEQCISQGIGMLKKTGGQEAVHP